MNAVLDKPAPTDNKYTNPSHVYDSQTLANKIVERYYDKPKTPSEKRQLIASALEKLKGNKVSLQDGFDHTRLKITSEYGEVGLELMQSIQRKVLGRGIDYAENKLRSFSLPKEEISNAHETYRQGRVEVYKRQIETIKERKKQECMRMQIHQSNEYNVAAKETAGENNLQNLIKNATVKS